MPEPSEEKVSRYCPECGKKVAATKSQFADPQICPSCKTRVLFLDYPRDRPPKADPIVDEIQKRDTKIHRHLSLLIVAAVLALLVFCFTALLMGQLTLFFVLACVALVAGIVGISIYLDGKSRANAVAAGFHEMQRRLQFHEENQTPAVPGERINPVFSAVGIC